MIIWINISNHNLESSACLVYMSQCCYTWHDNSDFKSVTHLRQAILRTSQRKLSIMVSAWTLELKDKGDIKFFKDILKMIILIYSLSCLLSTITQLLNFDLELHLSALLSFVNYSGWYRNNKCIKIYIYSMFGFLIRNL